MPRRSLLSNEQRIHLLAIPVNHAEMATHYVLSADDLVSAGPDKAALGQSAWVRC